MTPEQILNLTKHKTNDHTNTKLNDILCAGVYIFSVDRVTLPVSCECAVGCRGGRRVRVAVDGGGLSDGC
jgi:hypothetical protein